MYWVSKGGKGEKKGGFVSNVSILTAREKAQSIFSLVQYIFVHYLHHDTFHTPALLARHSTRFWTIQNVATPRTCHLSTTATRTNSHPLSLSFWNNAASLGVAVFLIQSLGSKAPGRASAWM